MAGKSWFWLSAALCALLLSSLLTPAGAAAQDPARFDVLVFSKTTGFRHADAIAAGIPGIQQMGAAEGFSVTATEDAAVFTDAGLRDYEVVVFLQTDGEGVLNPAQRTAFERWTSRGGGSVGIHADANADRNWAWKTDRMGGAQFKDHPSGALQFQDATVRIEDPDNPATQGIPADWVRNDEWYNFTAEPRGKVHVLATLDESTYDEQDGSAAADDHPIAWCTNYDGGRHFYTALGHFGTAWQEPLYRSHILGAIEWAAGEAEGDCGAPREGLPDRRVVRQGHARRRDREPDGDRRRARRQRLHGRAGRAGSSATTPPTAASPSSARSPCTAATRTGCSASRSTRASRRTAGSTSSTARRRRRSSTSRASRSRADGTVDMASEKVLLRIPHQRVICCHSSGSLAFGPDGNLYISTGDDTEHSASQGFAPLDDRLHDEVVSDNVDAKHAFDSRRSSGNTNDLRGKILRITPKDDGTYTIPAGNLFPPFSERPGEDAAGDLHDGPPQPVPDPRRSGDRLALQRRGRPRRQQRQRRARPARLRRAQPDPLGGQHGLAVLHREQQAVRRLDVPERPVRRAVRLRRRPGQRLRLEHRPEPDAAGQAGACSTGRTAPRPTSRRSRPAPAARRSPGRRTTTTRPTRPRSSSRAGTTTRSSSPTGRATGWRRSSSTPRATRRRTGSPSSCRSPTSATCRTWRSGRRRALRARVGPRLQLRGRRHQPRLRPVPDRVREGQPHAEGQGERRQGLRPAGPDRAVLVRRLDRPGRRRAHLPVGLRRRLADVDRGRTRRTPTPSPAATRRSSP